MKRILLFGFVAAMALSLMGANPTTKDGSLEGIGLQDEDADGFVYWMQKSVAARDSLDDVVHDTLRVVRDFNHDGTIDSVGASNDYAQIYRLDLYNTSPGVDVDTVHVQYVWGTTVTDSIALVFSGASGVVPYSLDIIADFALVSTGVSSGDTEILAVAYFRRLR